LGTVVVMLIVAFGLAACGGDDDDSGTVADGGATTTAAPSGDEEANTVKVTAEGTAFAPTTATATAGDVYFAITNNDSFNHTFTIDGTDVDIKLAPGKTSEGEAELKAGTYDWHCTIHSSMKGTLTVS
jgi:plastocyanin